MATNSEKSVSVVKVNMSAIPAEVGIPWQTEVECCPASLLRLHPHLSTVLGDNTLHNGKPETCSFLILYISQSTEPLKYSVMMFWINPNPTILHIKLMEVSPVFVPDLDLWILTISHELYRIDKQVLKNLTDPLSITPNGGKDIDYVELYLFLLLSELKA